MEVAPRYKLLTLFTLLTLLTWRTPSTWFKLLISFDMVNAPDIYVTNNGLWIVSAVTWMGWDGWD